MTSYLITRAHVDATRLQTRLDAIGQSSMIDALFSIDYHNTNIPINDYYCITSHHALRWLDQHAIQKKDYPLIVQGKATYEEAIALGFDALYAGQTSEALMAYIQQYHAEDGITHICGKHRSVALDTCVTRKKTIQICPVYEAVAKTSLHTKTIEAIKQRQIDAVIFCSSRTANIGITLFKKHRLKRFLSDMHCVVLSQKIAKSCQDIAWRKLSVTKEPNIDSLLCEIQNGNLLTIGGE